MLEEILNYIHNYFEKEIVSGTFTIDSGSIQLGFLQNNQYFRIVGSVFNDGIYKYPVDNLIDETFTGKIWAMAVPPAVVALVSEIEEWVGKYGSVQNSPYSSESFGGYSYTKSNGSIGSGNGAQQASWQGVFNSRLNHWRKIS